MYLSFDVSLKANGFVELATLATLFKNFGVVKEVRYSWMASTNALNVSSSLQSNRDGIPGNMPCVKRKSFAVWRPKPLNAPRELWQICLMMGRIRWRGSFGITGGSGFGSGSCLKMTSYIQQGSA